MSLVAICPSCKVQLTLGDDRAGSSLDCPKCGHAVAISAISPAEPISTSSILPPRAGSPSPQSNEHPTVPPQPATKKCPYCAEAISSAATRCSFCEKEVIGLADGATPEGKPSKRSLARQLILVPAVLIGCILIYHLFSADSDIDRARKESERLGKESIEAHAKRLNGEVRFPPGVNSDEEKIRFRLEAWIGDMKSGGSGEDFWEGTKFTRLLSVRSGSILKVTVTGSETAEAKVRIDSSNKGGSQITVTWRVKVHKNDGDWKITAISDDDR